MGTVTVQKYTTTNPISLIGEEAGICWGADITDEAKNHKRGIDCIKSDHGRAMEFPQIYLVLDGWSAKVIREFYTHIAGGPTRLQASTRYIDYSKGFENVVPRSVEGNEEAKKYLLERARVKRNRNKNRKEVSNLESLIIALVNTEQFKYDYDGVQNLTIYQFNESVQQIIWKIDYEHRMHGVYAGTINAKEMNQDEFNWLMHK